MEPSSYPQRPPWPGQAREDGGPGLSAPPPCTHPLTKETGAGEGGRSPPGEGGQRAENLRTFKHAAFREYGQEQENTGMPRSRLLQLHPAKFLTFGVGGFFVFFSFCFVLSSTWFACITNKKETHPLPFWLLHRARADWPALGESRGAQGHYEGVTVCTRPALSQPHLCPVTRPRTPTLTACTLNPCLPGAPWPRFCHRLLPPPPCRGSACCPRCALCPPSLKATLCGRGPLGSLHAP